jgi:hypothetical protein
LAASGRQSPAAQGGGGAAGGQHKHVVPYQFAGDDLVAFVGELKVFTADDGPYPAIRPLMMLSFSGR